MASSVNSRNPVSIVDGCVRRRVLSADFRMEKTKKNTFFQKRTGEVIENKGSGPKSEPERTGKRSGEVVENTFLWKKRTGKSKPAMLLKTKAAEHEPRREPHHRARLVEGGCLKAL